MYFNDISSNFYVDVQPSFECTVGSRSYHAHDADSDIDVVSVVIPKLESIFFSHYHKIFGFDDNSIYSVLKDDIIWGGLQIDYKLYNISVYLKHLMSGDVLLFHSLFVNQDCIDVSNDVYYIIRNKRPYFLTKLLIKNLKYKLDFWRNLRTSKAAYHYVRDIMFFHDILKDNTSDLRKNAQFLKDIRSGEFDCDEAIAYGSDILKVIEKNMSDNLPDSSPEYEVKRLLLNCIEHVHGSLAKFGF